MSNSVLTPYEEKTLDYMIAFLRNRGVNALCDRVERVLDNAKLGVLTRNQVFTSVIRDAAFRAIILAGREKNSSLIYDFLMFTMPYGAASLVLEAESLKSRV